MNSQVIYAGTLFLYKYYTVFDLSGYDPQIPARSTSLRVGIGKSNPKCTILDQNYNKFFPKYNSNSSLQALDQSSFFYTPNNLTYKPIVNPSGSVEEPTSNPMSNGHYNLMIGVACALTLLLLIILCCIQSQKRRARRDGNRTN